VEGQSALHPFERILRDGEHVAEGLAGGEPHAVGTHHLRVHGEGGGGANAAARRVHRAKAGPGEGFLEVAREIEEPLDETPKVPPGSHERAAMSDLR